MQRQGFMDDEDISNIDICGDLFDHIDDLLDFPNEDIEGDIDVGDDSNGLQSVWPPPPPQDSTSLFSNTNSNSDFTTELSVPDDDIAQLEWLSTFVEDSFSAGSFTLDQDPDDKNNNNDTHQFQIPSPVSVLESSSSCSGGRTMPINSETIVPGRARSKRPRPATFIPRPSISLVSPTSSVTGPILSFSSIKIVPEFENFVESHPSPKIPKHSTTEHKKRKKKKLAPLLGSMEQSASPQPMAVRKCLHCEITKTPQWRAGPMGPKTLCNACGVRYKSGRLFPEYRPAASPTFVPILHSNSHKKVLEMRSKTGPKIASAEDNASSPHEFLPSSSHLIDYK